MKPPNQTKLAALLGVSRQTISTWKREGQDLSDIEALKARAAGVLAKQSGAEGYHDARTRKLRAEANRAETLAAREAGELTPVRDVFGHGAALGLAFRQAMEKLTHDLPPILAGRSASEIFDLLKREHRSLLEKLRDTEPARYIENLKLSKP